MATTMLADDDDNDVDGDGATGNEVDDDGDGRRATTTTTTTMSTTTDDGDGDDGDGNGATTTTMARGNGNDDTDDNGDDNDDDVATTTMMTTTTTDDDGWDSPTDLSLARCSAPGKDRDKAYDWESLMEMSLGSGLVLACCSIVAPPAASPCALSICISVRSKMFLWEPKNKIKTGVTWNLAYSF